ncbi:MAG: sulfite exporter TauE/SafE family protein [Candidatus Zixiibacteriota bacterium]|nr:MAG: sulfite exporter TauE/SafE family protein [candidate division Zixibacteria bacterium]
MDWYLYPLVIAGGFMAGFINTFAGSGSLITLPILIFLGLPANVANGTNRVAIIMQNVTAVGSFSQQKVLDYRRGLILAIPTVLGALVGAQIAVSLDAETMKRVIGALMLVMLVIVLFRPRQWLEGHPGRLAARPGWTQMLIFFAIGIHGGFIQAGVGIFLLAGLVLSAGYELVRANAVKLLIVLCFTPLALIIFLAHDQVQWYAGLILGIGNMAGAWVASRMAVRRGAVFARYVLIVVLVTASTVLLGLSDLVRQML